MNMRAELNLEIPGIDDVVGAEAALARNDVERLQALQEAVNGELGRVAGELAALARRYKALKLEHDGLKVRSTTVGRVLHQRRRLLFDLEQERIA